MRFPILIAVICGCLLVSCKGEEQRLSPRKMENVLLDVQLAEVYSTLVPKDSVRHEAGGKNTDSLAAWYRSIFARHGITDAEFSKSVAWYREHPEELDSVYTRVLTRLEQMGRPAARAGLPR